MPGKLVFCVIVAGLVLTAHLWRILRSPLKNVPGPVWARLTGFYRVFIVWSGDCALKIQRLHGTYGPVVITGPNHVVISDPAAMFQIYGVGTKFKKTDFYRIFALFYDGRPVDTVFSTRNFQYHKLLKNQTAARFSLSSLRSSEPLVDMCTETFSNIMRHDAGKNVDLSEWLKYWAFDVNSAFEFKNSFGFMERHGDINGIIGGINSGFRYGAIIGQVPEWNAWLFENKIIMGFLRTVAGLGDPTTEIVQLIEERIRDCEKDLNPEDDCLLIWLRNEQQKKDSNLSHANMVMHLANYFVAGSVATSSSLSAIFYHLLKNPSAYRKLVEEVRGANAGNSPGTRITYDQSLQMPYLQAVIKESMRLCPSNNIPLERQVPNGGLDVCGYRLPEGTNVGISARMIHRNSFIYGDDVDVFRPERWLDVEEHVLSEMERHFFAFGRGERSCSGRIQAMMEMGKFVPQILCEFDVQWAAGADDWDEKSYWMPEHRGLIVKFNSRL